MQPSYQPGIHSNHVNNNILCSVFCCGNCDIFLFHMYFSIYDSCRKKNITNDDEIELESVCDFDQEY